MPRHLKQPNPLLPLRQQLYRAGLRLCLRLLHNRRQNQRYGWGEVDGSWSWLWWRRVSGEEECGDDHGGTEMGETNQRRVKMKLGFSPWKGLVVQGFKEGVQLLMGERGLFLMLKRWQSSGGGRRCGNQMELSFFFLFLFNRNGKCHCVLWHTCGTITPKLLGNSVFLVS